MARALDLHARRLLDPKYADEDLNGYSAAYDGPVDVPATVSALPTRGEAAMRDARAVRSGTRFAELSDLAACAPSRRSVGPVARKTSDAGTFHAFPDAHRTVHVFARDYGSEPPLV